MKRCKGETRNDGICAFDDTHRVCARLKGNDAFFAATGQRNWCHSGRCEPNWCICKWAFNDWVKKAGCDGVRIDCDATDVRNLLRSTTDGGRGLEHAKACVRKTCG